MDASMWVAKTGLDAQQTRMTVISNNLANVNTNGYKRDRAVFEDLLYQRVVQSGGQTSANSTSPTGMMLGTGVRVVATEKNHAQGNMVMTQNALDVAISGDGFFQILQPDGTLAYTRDGSFKLSPTGQLITSNGSLLQPTVQVPNNAQSITIGADGTVSAAIAGSTANSVLGNLTIARFINPAGLESIGQNLLRANAASGAVQQLKPGVNGAGVLVQGGVEASNVNVVEEMVNMIETQRAYEVNSKAIASADEMLKFINNNL
ncbi:MAG: flagellar basal-body rod protein FlgG [Betaproteobacteria bacterium]|jgi:flagellar basal-body rod protein FlgG